MKQIIIWIGLLSLSSTCFGKLQIDVSNSVEDAIPIAIATFSLKSKNLRVNEDIAAVIRENLRRSGYFQPLLASDMPTHPASIDAVNFTQWQQQKMDYLVIGSIALQSPTHYEVQFQLLDIYQQRQIAGLKISVPANDLRRTAHYISDTIYEKITGDKGVFNTRIAYITVSRQGKQSIYRLQIADADGQHPKTILKSIQPLMSPSWSHDGNHLAYVSFEQGQSAIFTQHISTGQRNKISAARGINGAPAWSPDDSKLAITLSKDGSPDIYTIDIATNRQTRLTYARAIDTEPVWSKDGQSIVFTSDRGGKPQLYRIDVNGGQPKRLTFTGNYNSRATFSPDGKLLAMVHGEDGQFHIATLELASGIFQVLTDGQLDESPSFSPNGRMILYATQQQNRGVLAAVSVDGRVKQRLVLQQGSVQEPAWSP